jgi:hypothetical protein
MVDARAQIARLLDLAKRARRLAPHFEGDDRTRLLKHADDLEREAAALEQQSGPNDEDAAV